ncbi:hypothetical protein [Bacillus sp. Cr_A10]|uniref:hypothetical protein n=1 Tax=Bacillus sp. Cr_A10 TaxID=3033993 RepID=UPI0023DC765B|nr:hypothetical protein [Bacillus sp. Cr_A10]MDF2065957.1 hypothetical protein [Bacillus sp. Cr_A10]
MLEGLNEEGSIRFSFESSDEVGVSRFANHPHIKIPIVGWEKENDLYTDFYFSINPVNGELNKHFRSY